MSAISELVEVKLSLPKETYDAACELARKEQHAIEEELVSLVNSGLDSHRGYQELMERLAERYQDRLARQGKLGQTKEEVLAELRQLREQVADELYPE